jgi:ribosomal protein S18 acetylase RimI-like enzyme
MAYTTAEFKPADTDALLRLWRASFEHGVGIVDPHPIDAQRSYFVDEVLPTHRVRVAWQGEELVGFMANRCDMLSQLYVHVQHLGHGLGTSFLRLAQADSPGRLGLYTFARNHRACRFYEQHGFKVAARGIEPFWQLEDVHYVWHAG